MSRNLTGLIDGDFDDVTISGTLSVVGTPTFSDIVVDSSISTTSIVSTGIITTTLGKHGSNKVVCTNLNLTSVTNDLPPPAITLALIQSINWAQLPAAGAANVGDLYNDGGVVKVKLS